MDDAPRSNTDRRSAAVEHPLLAHEHLGELADLVARLAAVSGPDDPVVADTSLGMRVAVTADRGGYHVSVSHPEHDAAGAARALGGREIARANGVVHHHVDGSHLRGETPWSHSLGALAPAICAGAPEPAPRDEAYFTDRPSSRDRRPAREMAAAPADSVR